MKSRFATTKLTLLAIAAMFLFVAPAISHADEVICPAVYPCDESGELIAMFEDSVDACATKFAAQCKKVRSDSRKQCSGLSQEYNRLQISHQKALSSVGKLKKALRKVRSNK